MNHVQTIVIVHVCQDEGSTSHYLTSAGSWKEFDLADTKNYLAFLFSVLK